ncbi:hypothetical protein COT42_03210 [Candidatus Saganbacteria bacterium CG08_land_8_20_14_0_20_45_16]|uniref:Uncharacterized protein n=1 Tax=Candidatus Saganbacteria bacterium CG08_land_8_20_14_0_20_45_16 TaxID=2014293 RepID=A0A2H0Y1A5_UNCSA|nr:MAG: hypothetical protein COT42_03210 [Candidatus Saganbacteria bacterium CG08_land_8_20_14_0_20_45_16]
MSIAQKSFILFRRDLFVYAISIVTSAIIARTLGPVQMGIWLICLMIPSYAEAFGRLKLDVSAVYFLGKKRCSLGEMTFIINVVSLFFGFLFFVLVVWQINFVQAFLFKNAIVPNSLIYLVMIFVVIRFIGMNYSYLLIYLEDVHAYNAFVFIQQILGSVFAIVFLVFFQAKLFGMIFALLFAGILSVMFAAWKIQKKEKIVPRFDLGIMADLIKFSYKLYLSGIVGFLNQYVSSLFVAYYLLPAQVAYFRMGQDKALLLQKIPQSISTILYPRISKLNDDDNNTAKITVLSFRVSLILMVLAAIAGIFLIKPVVLVLYGKDYLPLSIAFWILIPGLVLSGASAMFTQYFMGIGRPQIDLAISIVPLISQIILGFIFIPIYGVIGAAVTASFTLIIRSLVAMFVFHRISKVPLREVVLPTSEDFSLIFNFIKGQINSFFARFRKIKNNF